MVMDGVPTLRPGVAGAAAEESACPLATAIPAASEPAAAPAISRIHFRRGFAGAAPGWTVTIEVVPASARDCETISPARAESFAAVTLISKEPGVVFQRTGGIAAAPLAPVRTMSVANPLANRPPGPLAGSRKLTRAPSTASPVSPVIFTTTGVCAREPG